MAPSYGRFKGEPHRKEVTRRGFYGVDSRLETWDGAIKTEVASTTPPTSGRRGMGKRMFSLWQRRRSRP